MIEIHTSTLDCGMPLIIETIPSVRSVALSWLLPAGSARDPEARIGQSAMWSEMLFRGAGSLNSRAQADAFDRVGAGRSIDVATFHLSLSATLLGARLGEALPLIVETVRAPRFDPDGVEPVRDLCLQAIASLEDDPGERVMILAKEKHAAPPINRSGLGTPEGVRAVTRDDLLLDWEDFVRPVGSILAIAGRVDADKARATLNALLAGWQGEAAPVTPAPTAQRGYHHLEDDTNQVQIAVVHDAPQESSDDCVLERVATAVLSGGMAGRLFTEVREKRSLCYAVSASYTADRDYGRTLAYVGTTPQRAQESLDVLLDLLHAINTPQGRVTREEFDRAVVGMKSRLVMSGESTGARAGALARDWHKLGRARSLDELAQRIDAVTLEQVNGYLARRSLGEMTICTLGPAALTPPSGG